MTDLIDGSWKTTSLVSLGGKILLRVFISRRFALALLLCLFLQSTTLFGAVPVICAFCVFVNDELCIANRIGIDDITETDAFFREILVKEVDRLFEVQLQEFAESHIEVNSDGATGAIIGNGVITGDNLLVAVPDIKLFDRQEIAGHVFWRISPQEKERVLKAALDKIDNALEVPNRDGHYLNTEYFFSEIEHGPALQYQFDSRDYQKLCTLVLYQGDLPIARGQSEIKRFTVPSRQIEECLKTELKVVHQFGYDEAIQVEPFRDHFLLSSSRPEFGDLRLLIDDRWLISLNALQINNTGTDTYTIDDSQYERIIDKAIFQSESLHLIASDKVPSDEHPITQSFWWGVILGASGVVVIGGSIFILRWKRPSSHAG